VARLGFEKISHQPRLFTSVGEKSDVRNRPTVGTSQRIPTTTRRIWTGALLRKRTSFVEKRSSTTGPWTSAVAAVTLPPSGSA
jgi:hypothetical protein